MAVRELLILAPMQVEAQAIRSAISATSRNCPGVRVLRIGLGGRKMVQNLHADTTRGVLLAGFAGALDPALRPGDVVVEHDPREWGVELPYRAGRFLTQSAIVGTPREKSQLFAQTGADAVEMEQDIVRDRTRAAGIPFMSLRVIFDSADEILDQRLAALVSASGRAHPARVAMALLRPGMARKMWQLGRRTRTAGAVLGQAVRDAVERITAEQVNDRPAVEAVRS